MSRSADERGERLARALEGGAPAGGSGADEQLTRELAMVGLLVAAGRGSQARLGPDQATRERMRERILAGLAEPPAAEVIPIDAAARRRPAVAGVAGFHGRLLVASAAALCLLVALSAMSLVLARDALPGDALYGVKRSAESAELGLTFGDELRGFKHLQFATARVDEIEALAARADGSGAAGDPRRYLTALQAFDTDAAAGSRLLIDTATDGPGSELAALRAWAEQQGQRLRDAGGGMPSRAAARSQGSLLLLGRVLQRVDALQARQSCVAVTAGTRDDMGLLPADGPCVPATSGPGGQAPSPNASAVRPTTTQPPGSLVLPSGSGEPRPGGPLGPLDPGVTGPGATAPGSGPALPLPTQPLPSQPPATTPTAITIPLPLPEITVPPIVPGIPTP